MYKIKGTSVQFSLSAVSDSLRPHGLKHARPPCLITNPGVYSKLISIESMMPSNHLILCQPLFLLPSIFPSIRIFSSESALCIRCPKYWSSVLPMNTQDSQEYIAQYIKNLLKMNTQYFPGSTLDRNPPVTSEDTALIPHLGRSLRLQSN